MRTIRKGSIWLSLAAAALLSACGGGGDGGGTGGGIVGPGAPGSQVPAYALQSSDALIAWMKRLIAADTNETAQPLALGDITLPTSDTTEPVQ